MMNVRGVRMSAAVLIASGGAASLAPGCAKKTVIAEPPARAFQRPAVFHGEGRPVSELIPSAGASLSGPTLLAQQRLSGRSENGEGVAPTALENEPGELVQVEISLKAADFADELRVLIGEYLGRDFVIDPKVTGPVTLEIDGEFTKGELMQVIGHLGSLYGWFLEEREGILFVRAGDRLAKAADAPILVAAPALAGDQPAVRVRRLKYVGADQVSTLLKDLISENAKALVAGKTLVLADTTRQITRLSKLIGALDTPSFDGTEVWTYRLGHRRPEDAQKLLETIATGTGLSAAGADSAVAFVAVPGTQRLMVIAKDATLQPMIRELLLQVDQPGDGERRQRYVYRVQHYPQAALVKLLADFFGEKIESQPGVAAATGGVLAEPGSRIRIASDNQSDLLLIHATPTDYADLLATLRAVDRPPQQVVVQSIIAEVSLTNALEFGVEYFLSQRTSLGELELTGSTPLANSLLATGGAFFIGGSGFAVIQALDRESETRILSQPKLVMSDRTKGSIQVGGEVPVTKATQGTGTGASDIREEIEYRDTGVILTIEPAINESGTVLLKLTQEVLDVIQTTTVADNPSFTTRKIETSVIVPSGQTVLLGGIINERLRKFANRIPLLGRVPVVGEVFSNKQDDAERTELLLAITPTILNEPVELAGATAEFLQSVESVRSALLDAAEELPTGSMEDLSPPLPENPLPDRPEKAEKAPAL
jgi:general secretion pathway protein D